MATTIKFKRGLAATWVKLNLVLEPGEPGFEIDTGKLKIGNGTDAWLDLDYIGENVGGNSGSGENIAYVINAPTHFSFPSIGSPNVIYKAEEEKKIYQWNSSLLAYEAISEVEDVDDLPNIRIIHGGNADYE